MAGKAGGAGLSPVRRFSVADEVAKELRGALRAGRYKPGDRLVQEDLATALGVSRTPLRHALAQLAGEGIVEEAGQGYRVAVTELRHALEMFEIYAAVEAHAARLAAVHADDEWLGVLERAARRAPVRPSRDPEREPTEFHDLVAAATRNAPLIRLRPVAMSAVDLSFADTVRLASPPDRTHSSAEHEEIWQAIRDRDPERAAAIAAAHVRAGARRLAEQLAAPEYLVLSPDRAG